MTRSHFIEADETLLSVTAGKHFKDKLWARETPFFGRPMTDAEVLEELSDDEIVMVRRVNTVTWESDDVTDLCARKYLYALDEKSGVSLEDEDKFPAYVRNSAEWARWKRDLPSQEQVYNPIHEHGTWNHAQAGLRSAAV